MDSRTLVGHALERWTAAVLAICMGADDVKTVRSWDAALGDPAVEALVKKIACDGAAR
jgi:hypothetical protein